MQTSRSRYSRPSGAPADRSPARRDDAPGFRRVAANSAWSAGAGLLTTGALFLESVVLARHLGASQYGVFLLAYAYPQAVQLFLDFRTRETLTRYLSGYLVSGDKRRAVALVKFLWLTDFVVICVALLLIWVTAPWIGPALTGSSVATELVRIAALATFVGGLDAIAGSTIRVYDRFRLSFATSGIAVGARLVIIITIVRAGGGLEAIVWAPVLAEAVTTVVLSVVAFRLLRTSLRGHWGVRVSELREELGSILRFMMQTNLLSALRAASSKLDVLVVGVLAGPIAASTYKVSVQVGSSTMLLADPIHLAAYPAFSRMLAAGESQTLRVMGLKLSRMIAAAAIPLTLCGVVVAPELLPWLFGSTFHDAVLPSIIILLGNLPAVILVWGRAAYLAAGDAGFGLRVVALGTVTQLALLLSLTGTLGATGAALAFAAMSTTIATMTAFYLHRRRLL